MIVYYNSEENYLPGERVIFEAGTILFTQRTTAQKASFGIGHTYAMKFKSGFFDPIMTDHLHLLMTKQGIVHYSKMQNTKSNKFVLEIKDLQNKITSCGFRAFLFYDNFEAFLNLMDEFELEVLNVEKHNRTLCEN